jgi:ribosome-binding protein aMBF1 (putative translation factor)
MAQCAKCGISDEKTPLYGVITKEGIIKLCENCARSSDSPVIRKPTAFQLREMERKPTVYERLSRMAGIDKTEKKTDKTDFLLRQEKSLRAIVDMNYRERAKPEKRERPDLMDNFHWAIMRARRSKKLTQKQLADAIGEPEAAIKKAEEGALPDDNDRLLNRIQAYLSIDLSRNSSFRLNEPRPAFVPDSSHAQNDEGMKSTSRLTIADLKKMRGGKEDSGRADAGKNEEENPKDKKDISEEDMHNLLFKRK